MPYSVANQYRLPQLGWVAAIFLVLVAVFGRWRGISAVLGLAFSVLVVAAFIVPRVLDGWNPLLVSLLGSFAILLVSLYVSHGFNRRTSVALGSSLLTLGVTAGLAVLFVQLAKLFGVGSEEATFLQFNAVGF